MDDTRDKALSEIKKINKKKGILAPWQMPPLKGISFKLAREQTDETLLSQLQNECDNPKYYHLIKLTQIHSYDRLYILKSTLDFVYPSELIPCHYFQCATEVRFLVRRCKEALLKIVNNNFLIPHFPSKPPADGIGPTFEAAIVANFCEASLVEIDRSENILEVMKTRFKKETGTLDLSNFASDKGLEEYCPLFEPRMLLFVIYLSTALENVKVINLKDNCIRHITCIDVLKVSKVETIDLAYNQIEHIEDIKGLSDAPGIRHLKLEHNPLCSNYENYNYVIDVKMLLPNLETLDGVDVTSPLFKKNFICSPDAQDLTRQFLEHFYTIYDSDEREDLEDFYEKDAFFSVNVRVIPFQKNSYSVRLSHYGFKHPFTVQSRKEIMKLFKSFPRTQHDTYTFVCDLSIFMPKCAVLTVGGIFKEMNQVLGFSRTFVLKYFKGSYTIANDQMTVYNATDYQLGWSFSFPSRVEYFGNPLPYYPEQYEVVGEVTQKLSKMNLQYTKMLLDYCDYDVSKALYLFSELYKNNLLPDEAFQQQEGQENDCDKGKAVLPFFSSLTKRSLEDPSQASTDNVWTVINTNRLERCEDRLPKTPANISKIQRSVKPSALEWNSHELSFDEDVDETDAAASSTSHSNQTVPTILHSINSRNSVVCDTSSDSSAVIMPNLPITPYSKISVRSDLFPSQTPDPCSIYQRIQEVVSEKAYASTLFKPGDIYSVSKGKEKVIVPKSRIPSASVYNQNALQPSASKSNKSLAEPCTYISIDEDDDISNVDKIIEASASTIQTVVSENETSTSKSSSQSCSGSQLIEEIIKEREKAAIYADKVRESESAVIEPVDKPSTTMSQREIDTLYRKVNRNSFPWLDRNHTKRFKYLLQKRLVNRKLCDIITDGLKRKQMCELLDEELTTIRLRSLYRDGYLANDPIVISGCNPRINAPDYLNKVQKERLQWCLNKNLLSKNYHKYFKQAHIKEMTSKCLTTDRLKTLYEHGYLMKHPRLVTEDKQEVPDVDVFPDFRNFRLNRRGNFFQKLVRFFTMERSLRKRYTNELEYFTEYVPYRPDEVLLAARYAIHTGVPRRKVLNVLNNQLQFRNTSQLENASGGIDSSTRKRSINSDRNESSTKKPRPRENSSSFNAIDVIILEDDEEQCLSDKSSSETCLTQKVHHIFTAEELIVVKDLNEVQKHRLRWLLDHNLLGKKYFKYTKPESLSFITKERLTVQRLWVLFTKEWLIRDPAFLFDNKSKRNICVQRTNFSSSIYSKKTIISHSKYCQKLYNYLEMNPESRANNVGGIRDYLIEYTPYRFSEVVCTVKYALAKKHRWDEISAVLRKDGLVRGITELEIKVFGFIQPITESVANASESITNMTEEDEISISDNSVERTSNAEVLNNGNGRYESVVEIEDVGPEDHNLDTSVYLKPYFVKPRERKVTNNKMQLIQYVENQHLEKSTKNMENVYYAKNKQEEDTAVCQTVERIIHENCRHLNETQKDRIRWLLSHNLLGKKCYTYFKPHSWKYVAIKTLSMFRLWYLYRSKKIIRDPGFLFENHIPLEKQKALVHVQGCTDVVDLYCLHGTRDRFFRQLYRYLKGVQVDKVRNYMLDYAPYRYDDLVAAVKYMSIIVTGLPLAEVSTALEQGRLVGNAEKFECDVNNLQTDATSCNICAKTTNDKKTKRLFPDLELEEISDEESSVLTANVQDKAVLTGVDLEEISDEESSVLLTEVMDATSDVPINEETNKDNRTKKSIQTSTMPAGQDIEIVVISDDEDTLPTKSSDSLASNVGSGSSKIEEKEIQKEDREQPKKRRKVDMQLPANNVPKLLSEMEPAGVSNVGSAVSKIEEKEIQKEDMEQPKKRRQVDMQLPANNAPKLLSEMEPAGVSNVGSAVSKIEEKEIQKEDMEQPKKRRQVDMELPANNAPKLLSEMESAGVSSVGSGSSKIEEKEIQKQDREQPKRRRQVDMQLPANNAPKLPSEMDPAGVSNLGSTVSEIEAKEIQKQDREQPKKRRQVDMQLPANNAPKFPSEIKPAGVSNVGSVVSKIEEKEIRKEDREQPKKRRKVDMQLPANNAPKLPSEMEPAGVSNVGSAVSKIEEKEIQKEDREQPKKRRQVDMQLPANNAPKLPSEMEPAGVSNVGSAVSKIEEKEIQKEDMEQPKKRRQVDMQLPANNAPKLLSEMKPAGVSNDESDCVVVVTAASEPSEVLKGNVNEENDSVTKPKSEIVKFFHLKKNKKSSWLIYNGFLSKDYKSYFPEEAKCLTVCDSLFRLWSYFKEGFFIRDPTAIYAPNQHTSFYRIAEDRLDKVKGNFIYKPEINKFIQKLDIFVRSKLQQENCQPHVQAYLLEYMPYRRNEIIAFVRDALNEFGWTGVSFALAHIMPQEQLSQLETDVYEFLRASVSCNMIEGDANKAVEVIVTKSEIATFFHSANRYERLKWLIDNRFLSKHYLNYFPFDKIQSLLDSGSLIKLWSFFKGGLLIRDPTLIYASEQHANFHNKAKSHLDNVDGVYIYKNKLNIFIRKLDTFVRSKLEPEYSASATTYLTEYLMEYLPYRHWEVVAFVRNVLKSYEWTKISTILADIMNEKDLSRLENDVYRIKNTETTGDEESSVSHNILLEHNNQEKLKIIGSEQNNTKLKTRSRINDVQNNGMKVILYLPRPWEVSVQNRIFEDSCQKQSELTVEANSETIEFASMEQEEIVVFRCLNEVQKDRLRWLLRKKLLSKLYYKYFSLSQLRTITSEALTWENLFNYFVFGYLIKDPEFLFNSSQPLKKVQTNITLKSIRKGRTLFHRIFHYFLQSTLTSNTDNDYYNSARNYVSEYVTHRDEELVRLLKCWSVKHSWSELSPILEKELSIRNIQDLASKVHESAVIHDIDNDEESICIKDIVDEPRLHTNLQNDVDMSTKQKNDIQIVAGLKDLPGESKEGPNKRCSPESSTNSDETEFDKMKAQNKIKALRCLNTVQKDKLQWLVDNKLLSEIYYEYFSDSELKLISTDDLCLPKLWHMFFDGYLIQNPEFLFGKKISVQLKRGYYRLYKSYKKTLDIEYADSDRINEEVQTFLLSLEMQLVAGRGRIGKRVRKQRDDRYDQALYARTKTKSSIQIASRTLFGQKLITYIVLYIKAEQSDAVILSRLRNYLLDYLPFRLENVTIILHHMVKKYPWTTLKAVFEKSLQIYDISCLEKRLFERLGRKIIYCTQLVPYVPRPWDIKDNNLEQETTVAPCVEIDENNEVQLNTEAVVHLSELEKDRLRWLLNNKLLSTSFHRYFSADQVKSITKHPLTLYVLWFLFEYGYITRDPGFLFEANIPVEHQRELASKLYDKYTTNQFRRKFGSYLGLSMKSEQTSNNALDDHRSYVLEYVPHRYQATVSYLKQYRVFTKRPWDKISSILEKDRVIQNVADLEVSMFGSKHITDEVVEKEMDCNSRKLPFSNLSGGETTINDPESNEDAATVVDKVVDTVVGKSPIKHTEKSRRGRKKMSKENARKKKIHKYLESLKRKIRMPTMRKPVLSDSLVVQEQNEEDDVFEEFQELDADLSPKIGIGPSETGIDLLEVNYGPLSAINTSTSKCIDIADSIEELQVAKQETEIHISDSASTREKMSLNDDADKGGDGACSPNRINKRSAVRLSSSPTKIVKNTHFEESTEDVSTRISMYSKPGCSKSAVEKSKIDKAKKRSIVEDSDCEEISDTVPAIETRSKGRQKIMNRLEDTDIEGSTDNIVIVNVDSDSEEIGSTRMEKKSEGGRKTQTKSINRVDKIDSNESTDNSLSTISTAAIKSPIEAIEVIVEDSDSEETSNCPIGKTKVKSVSSSSGTIKEFKKTEKILVVKIENAEKMIRKALSTKSKSIASIRSSRETKTRSAKKIPTIKIDDTDSEEYIDDVATSTRRQNKKSGTSKVVERSKEAKKNEITIVSSDSTEGTEDIIKEVETFLQTSEMKLRKSKRRLGKRDRKLKDKTIEPTKKQNTDEATPTGLETVEDSVNENLDKTERKTCTIRLRRLTELTGSCSMKRAFDDIQDQSKVAFSDKRIRTDDDYLIGVNAPEQSDEVVMINEEVIPFK